MHLPQDGDCPEGFACSSRPDFWQELGWKFWPADPIMRTSLFVVCPIARQCSRGPAHTFPPGALLEFGTNLDRPPHQCPPFPLAWLRAMDLQGAHLVRL